jgi:tetratricopeptide (TPR) repeat protein
VCTVYAGCLRLASTRPASVSRIFFAVTFAVAAALGARTLARNAQYAAPLSLWESSVERWPHGRVRMGYAIELLTASRNEDAIVQLREAVKDFPDARSPLGSALLIANHVDQAIRELTMFIEANPTKPDRTLTRLLLGRAFLLQARPDEAVQQYRAILDRFPDHADARQGLTMAAGVYLRRAETVLRENRFQDAESLVRSSLAINAADAKAHNILGVSLISQERADEAIAEFHEAIRLDPGDGQAQRNLARALAMTGSQH